MKIKTKGDLHMGGGSSISKDHLSLDGKIKEIEENF
jgi:hypothetical protein